MFNGTNAAGGEIEYGTGNTTNPVSGKDYLFLTSQDIDYIYNKKMNFIRLLFSWEALQPALNGPLATNNYATDFFACINYITQTKGLYCLIEPHGASSPNFARYKGNLVGSSQVPNSAFADFWNKLSSKFINNNKLFIGLSNEPNNMSTMQWYSAAQAAITSIRNAGFTNYIFVPGNGWSNASGWLDSWYDTSGANISNAVGWKTLTDPLNKLVATVHNYADTNGGGLDTSIVNNTVLIDRLSKVVNWAKTNGIKVHMSEFGVSATNPLAQTTINNIVNYMNNNSDTIIGAAWWAIGNPAWWSNYKFTLCPSNNYTIDSPQMNLLSNTGGFLNPASPTPTPVINIKLTNTNVKFPGDQGFNSSKMVLANQNVPAGTYTIKTATRTTYSDTNTVCVNLFFTNEHTNVDLSWDSITIDLRGHTLQDYWNCTLLSASGTTITLVPTTDTKTILAQNKVSIGFCFKRMTDPTKSYYQVLVKSIKW